MNAGASNVTEFDPVKLRKAWLAPLIPGMIGMACIALGALELDRSTVSTASFVVGVPAILAAVALRTRYGMAPSTAAIDRMARRQSCIRVNSMPWLSFALIVIGVATVVAAFTAMKLNPSEFFHDSSLPGQFMRTISAPFGLMIAAIGWQRPWDATVKRVVDL